MLIGFTIIVALFSWNIPLLQYQQPQIVVQASINASTSLLGLNEDEKLYDNSTYGLNMTYFNNWTQANKSSVNVLNQQINQSFPDQDIQFLTYFFPNATSAFPTLANETSSTLAGLTVTNATRYNASLSKYINEVGKTINNIGGQEVKTFKSALAGNLAEGIEYTADNLTKTTNISTLKDDLIYTFVYAAPVSSYNMTLPIVQDMKDSLSFSR